MARCVIAWAEKPLEAVVAGSKGVWFDTKAGKVVESQPEEGVQLVAPGVEATAAEQAAVDSYKSGGNTVETVTTKAVKSK
jgi:hypothetical protein